MRKLQTAPGAAGDILVELRHLHLRAGEPSMRAIARLTGAISHDTVHRILTGPDVPQWGPLELVVEALHGDVELFRELWITARSTMDEDRA
jgi:hypothetical protein